MEQGELRVTGVEERVDLLTSNHMCVCVCVCVRACVRACVHG